MGGPVNWVDSSQSVSAPQSHEALDSLHLFCTHQGPLLSPRACWGARKGKDGGYISSGGQSGVVAVGASIPEGILECPFQLLLSSLFSEALS